MRTKLNGAVQELAYRITGLNGQATSDKSALQPQLSAVVEAAAADAGVQLKLGDSTMQALVDELAALMLAPDQKVGIAI